MSTEQTRISHSQNKCEQEGVKVIMSVLMKLVTLNQALNILNICSAGFGDSREYKDVVVVVVVVEEESGCDRIGMSH